MATNSRDSDRAPKTAGICTTLKIDELDLKRQFLNGLRGRVHAHFRKHRIRRSGLAVGRETVRVTTIGIESRADASKIIQQLIYPTPGRRGPDITIKRSGNQIVLSPTRATLDDLATSALTAAVPRMKNWLEANNIRGYVVERNGRSLLLVKTPGKESISDLKLKKLIQRWSRTSVHSLHSIIAPTDLATKKPALGLKIYPGPTGSQLRYLVRAISIATGQDLLSVTEIREKKGKLGIRLQFRSGSALHLRRTFHPHIARPLVLTSDHQVVAVSERGPRGRTGSIDFTLVEKSPKIDNLISTIRLSFLVPRMTFVSSTPCNW